MPLTSGLPLILARARMMFGGSVRRLENGELLVETGPPSAVFAMNPEREASVELEWNENHPSGPSDLVSILIDIEVLEGSVGIRPRSRTAMLGADWEFSAGMGRKKIELRTIGPFRFLHISNLSDEVVSKVIIRELAATVAHGEGDLADTEPELFLDDSVTRNFTGWSGTVRAGYAADWSGAITNARELATSPYGFRIATEDRFEAPTIPFDSYDVIDWIPLLQSVATGSGTFAMAELGCGFGRWLVPAALLASQLGRDYRVYGAEAEPTHFAWLERHVRENGLDAERCTFVNAAVANAPANCWFATGNAADWWGQAILRDEDLPQIDSRQFPIGAEVQAADHRIRRIRSIDIHSMVQDMPVIDYLHMDVQGSETDFLLADPGVLDASVRMINVGTHSAQNERALRKLFGSLGWEMMYDVRLGSRTPIRTTQGMNVVAFNDGAQVWLNPRLAVRE